jgi:MtN3 and saliva related transmembrane protein
VSAAGEFGLVETADVVRFCSTSGFNDTRKHRHVIIPELQRSEIIGLVAGFGTTFAALPDLIKMLKRRSAKGMNPTMAAILGVFQIVWIYYGLLIDSWPLVMWNVVAVLVNSLSVATYVWFARREKSQPIK